MESWNKREEETALLAGTVCTACNGLMSDLLEIEAQYLHCCLKVMVPGRGAGQEAVETWMRSEPYDGRSDSEAEGLHLVSQNSVWSALLGRYDGKFNWLEPFCCFACNDLYAHQDQYMNSRANWRGFYRSTLVFPLRYTVIRDGRRLFNAIGFLAFDSPRDYAFQGLPDIFCYREGGEKKATYSALLQTTASFHLAAVMADTLSMFLRPVYEKDAAKGGA